MAWLKATGRPVWAFIVGILGGATAFVLIVFLSEAAAPLTQTPANFAAAESSILRAGITATATSLTLEPLKKWVNGQQVTGCFNTSSGTVLLEDFAGRSEWISFGSASCSSNVTTLSNLRRGLNPTSTSGSLSAGVGLAFDAGARVRLIDHPVVYVNQMNKDLTNILTGSGKIMSDSITSHAIFQLNAVTTAQRDALVTALLGDGDMIYNSTIGTPQFRAGSAWYSFGSGGGVVDAGLATRGGVELATLTEMRLSVGTGSAAPLVLTPLRATGSSVGEKASDFVALLGTGGRLMMANGGLGRGSILTGSLLIGAGAEPIGQMTANTSGGVIVSNGTVWRTSLARYAESKLSTTETGTQLTTAGTSADFSDNLSLSAPTAGDTYEITAVGTTLIEGSDGIIFQIQVNDYGDSVHGNCSWDNPFGATTYAQFKINARLVFQAVGASARALVGGDCLFGTGTGRLNNPISKVNTSDVMVGEINFNSSTGARIELSVENGASATFNASLLLFDIEKVK